MVPMTQGSSLQVGTVRDFGRQIVINRLVGGIVLGLWALQISTIGLGYVFTAVNLDDSLAFEIVWFIWGLIVYLPISLFSIVVLDPVLDLAYYQVASALGPVGSFMLFVAVLTVIYGLVGIGASLLVLTGKKIKRVVGER